MKLLRQQNRGLNRLQDAAGLVQLKDCVMQVSEQTRGLGLGFRKPASSFSVPKGSEAKFLSEIGFKTTLNCCVSEQKCQVHP